MDFSPDKHLIVFGAGYVGAELTRSAVARGLRVTALTRNAAKAAELVAAGVETVVADLAGHEWHGRIAAEADYAVNCVSSGGGGVAGYRRSYVGGMRSLLAWAAGGRVGTLVYTGSTSVYPQGGGAWVDEEAPVGGGGARADVLVEAENMLWAAGRENGGVRRAFILRLAGIYGPGRHHLLDELRAGAAEMAGCGEHHLNLIHRDDIVSAIWAALAAPVALPGGVFNVADDGAATKAAVTAWLAARLGRPAPVFTGASGAGRITPDRVISNAKIKRGLGWVPRYPTFREGYEKILSR